MSEASSVSLVSITKSFGGPPVVDDVCLEIEAGEFFSILGSSGSGKTTLLRLIAGLERCDRGVILFGRTDMTGVPAFRRPCNTVFQSYALFPHLTVYENVAFGLRMARVDSSSIGKRVREALDGVQIGHLASRKPAQLSGGQQQRVALARALVNDPSVLLLDEPLGALDLKLRRELQIELTRLKHRVRTTFVYVTHDQEEAFSMSDRIAIMESGRVAQVGTPRAVFSAPATPFVARFLGFSNIVEGTVDGDSVRTPLGSFPFPEGRRLDGESTARLAIRPDRIALRAAADDSNGIAGTVTEILFSGTETRVIVNVAPIELTVIKSTGEIDSAGIVAGSAVSLMISDDAVSFLGAGDGRNS